MTTFNRFLRDETAAITIDWVALTAGILLLGVGIVALLFDETSLLTLTMQCALAFGENCAIDPKPSDFVGGPDRWAN